MKRFAYLENTYNDFIPRYHPSVEYKLRSQDSVWIKKLILADGVFHLLYAHNFADSQRERIFLIILKITMAANTSNNEHFRHEVLLAHRHTSFYIILSFENILGLVGNTFFLLSFMNAKKCTSNMYLIMKSLSVVDLVSSFSFIQTLIQELVVKNSRVQYELCRYHTFFRTTFFLNNILHITLMAIDRHTAIAIPHR